MEDVGRWRTEGGGERREVEGGGSGGCREVEDVGRWRMWRM